VDAELRAFLEDRFGRLDQRMEGIERRIDRLEQRMDGVEQRIGGLEQRMDGLEQRLGALEPEVASLRSQVGQLGVLLESVQHQVCLVAEGHSVLYGAIDRQYEEVRAELRDVRALLRVWNDLVTRRLGDLEYRIREKVG
jgi:archaellum component FlaC